MDTSHRYRHLKVKQPQRVKRRVDEHFTLPPTSLLADGQEAYLVKLPNFLHIEREPFDPEKYKAEEMEDEGEDEQATATESQRVKLKVENTIRWRVNAKDEGVCLMVTMCGVQA